MNSPLLHNQMLFGDGLSECLSPGPGEVSLIFLPPTSRHSYQNWSFSLPKSRHFPVTPLPWRKKFAGALLVFPREVSIPELILRPQEFAADNQLRM